MIVLDFGGQSAISTITVTSAPIASMAIETQRLTLRVGQTIRLSVSARDSADNAVTVRSISWSSDDQAVATVSSSGLLACLHGGGPCMRLAPAAPLVAPSGSIGCPPEGVDVCVTSQSGDELCEGANVTRLMARECQTGGNGANSSRARPPEPALARQKSAHACESQQSACRFQRPWESHSRCWRLYAAPNMGDEVADRSAYECARAL